jgi:flagellar hook-associated protein 3 FlgL
MIYDLSVAGMQQRQQDQLHLQQQISSGSRLLAPSDDPIASSTVLNVKQSQALNQQYKLNGDAAKSQLQLEESSLTDLTRLLQDVHTLAVNAGNAPLTNSDRASIATELENRYQELLGIANRGDGNGQYLFSGYQGSTRPFGESGPGVVNYAGDAGQRLAQIGPSRTIAVSDSGDSVFRSIRSGNGTFVTTAGAGNSGNGIVDTGTLMDPVRWNATTAPKDLTIRIAQNATATAGVANTGGAGAAGGIVNQAQWNAGSRDYTIEFTAPNAYDIKDTASGATVQSGAYVSGGTISFMGAQAVISDGPGPAGPASGDRFRIVQADPPGYSYDIVDNVNNLSLLTGAAPGAAPYLRTFVPGAAISLATQSPPDTSLTPFDYGAVVSVSGTPAAGDSFTVKSSSERDVFTTLNNLITALRGGIDATSGSAARYQNALNTSLTEIDNSLNTVLTVRASVGSRLNEVDTAQTASDDVSLQYAQTISALQDLDYTKAISELNQQQIFLQAAQQSFLKITKLSLFDML